MAVISLWNWNSFEQGTNKSIRIERLQFFQIIAHWCSSLPQILVVIFIFSEEPWRQFFFRGSRLDVGWYIRFYPDISGFRTFVAYAVPPFFLVDVTIFIGGNKYFYTKEFFFCPAAYMSLIRYFFFQHPKWTMSADFWWWLLDPFLLFLTASFDSRS